VGPTASFSYPNMGQDSSKQGKKYLVVEIRVLCCTSIYWLLWLVMKLSVVK